MILAPDSSLHLQGAPYHQHHHHQQHQQQQQQQGAFGYAGLSVTLSVPVPAASASSVCSATSVSSASSVCSAASASQGQSQGQGQGGPPTMDSTVSSARSEPELDIGNQPRFQSTNSTGVHTTYTSLGSIALERERVESGKCTPPAMRYDGATPARAGESALTLSALCSLLSALCARRVCQLFARPVLGTF